MEREIKATNQETPQGGNDKSSIARENRITIRKQAQPNLLIKIQDIFFMCLRSWKWYFLSLAICLGYTYYQLLKAPNVYYRGAAIMIKGDERHPTALLQFGIENAPQDVANEIMAIRSIDVATQVAKRLNLDVEYFHEESFLNQVVYGYQLPVKIVFHDLTDEESLSCFMELRADSTVRISRIAKQGVNFTGAFLMRLGQTRKTPIGVISIEGTPSYQPGTTDNLLVVRSSIGAAAGTVAGRFSANVRYNTTIIDMGYVDLSTQRAEDVLNTIVEVYNESWIHDKNKVTELTNDFINQQIAVLERELNEVEGSIADYKSERLILNVHDEGTKALSIVENANDRTFDIENQIYMIEYMREYIESPDNIDKLLPLNTGIQSTDITRMLSEYNSTLQQRNGHLAHSSDQNPLVRDLNEKLATIRENIIQTMDNEIMMLNNEKEKVESRRTSAEEKVAAAPRQSIYFTSIERQKAIKENLYTFLLQKKADNELSQAFTAYNTRLIEPPHGSYAPISPTPMKSYTNALLIGMLIPTIIVVIKEGFNTAVRGRKDMEHLSVPFVGEIPLDAAADKRAKAIAKQKKKLRKRGKHMKEAETDFVVMEKSRNVMNEAFRVVRSNLEFILGFDKGHHIIMITSLNPSSGKTFITANLASSIGINNKRVIAVDVDMRKGTLSKYANKPVYGVSNYLSGQFADYRDLIVHKGNIDILPCGVLPPNPTELLYTDAFDNMMKELQRDYDYVFLDCPPVEVVADAQIINRYADMTLFVVRAHLLDRAFLPDVETWYQEKRYNNLTTILNGTTDAFSRYGYHKYGYRYGYHYGNYGYGYGNEK